MQKLIFLVVLTAISSPGFAWEAHCPLSGRDISVTWPNTPFEVAKDGFHEIHILKDSDSQLSVGEVTTWLVECNNDSCIGSDIHQFELNTFSEDGLMYCYPTSVY